MISYADLEFAISRWKARAAGVPQPAAPMPSGAVAAPILVSNQPEEMSESEGQDGVVHQSDSSNTSDPVVPDGDLFGSHETS
jgi:hypothetical protein